MSYLHCRRLIYISQHDTIICNVHADGCYSKFVGDNIVVNELFFRLSWQGLGGCHDVQPEEVARVRRSRRCNVHGDGIRSTLKPVSDTNKMFDKLSRRRKFSQLYELRNLALRVQLFNPAL